VKGASEGATAQSKKTLSRMAISITTLGKAMSEIAIQAVACTVNILRLSYVDCHE